MRCRGSQIARHGAYSAHKRRVVILSGGRDPSSSARFAESPCARFASLRPLGMTGAGIMRRADSRIRCFLVMRALRSRQRRAEPVRDINCVSLDKICALQVAERFLIRAFAGVSARTACERGLRAHAGDCMLRFGGTANLSRIQTGSGRRRRYADASSSSRAASVAVKLATPAHSGGYSRALGAASARAANAGSQSSM